MALFSLCHAGGWRFLPKKKRLRKTSWIQWILTKWVQRVAIWVAFIVLLSVLEINEFNFPPGSEEYCQHTLHSFLMQKAQHKDQRTLIDLKHAVFSPHQPTHETHTTTQTEYSDTSFCMFGWFWRALVGLIQWLVVSVTHLILTEWSLCSVEYELV